MSGEDKILAILEQLQQGQAATNDRLDRLEQGQSKLQQGQSKLEQEVADLKDTVQAVKESQLKVELEQLPKIKAALDGHKLNSEKLDDILKNLEEITPTVQALEILHQTGYAK